jgi:arylsulfatase
MKKRDKEKGDVLTGRDAWIARLRAGEVVSFREGGHLTRPRIARWPKVIGAGALRHEPGHVIAIMATCVDVAGATYPTRHNDHSIPTMEGPSLRPLLQGRALQRPAPLFWEHEGNRAVRDGRWKLVSRFNTGNAWQTKSLTSGK